MRVKNLKEHFHAVASFGQGGLHTTENGGMGMRILLAILAIAALAGTAHAQDAGAGGGLGGGGHKGRGAAQNTQQKADPKKQKAIDDAYKSAIGRIPDPKEKYDPWKTAR
jgi:hypothetical protein